MNTTEHVKTLRDAARLARAIGGEFAEITAQRYEMVAGDHEAGECPSGGECAATREARALLDTLAGKAGEQRTAALVDQGGDQ